MFRTPFVIPLIIALAAPLLVSSTAAAENDDEQWHHVLRSDGVDVFERDARWLGETAFAGIIEIDLPISQVIPVFIDPDEREHWVYRMGEQEMIDREEPNRAWSERYWVRVDMPFPARDRDYVFHTEYEIHPDLRQVTATLHSVEDPRMPEQDCCVRAESITRYVVEAIPGEERTRIRVAVETDLKGWLPAGITEQAEREWPVETLSALAQRIYESEHPPDERFQNWHTPQEVGLVDDLTILSDRYDRDSPAALEITLPDGFWRSRALLNSARSQDFFQGIHIRRFGHVVIETGES